MKLRLPFGLKNGELVEVAKVSSGLACGCRCPSCGSRLMAKKGNQNHHFAHYGAVDCIGSFETALHILAKQFLNRAKGMMIPAVHLANGELLYEEQSIPIHEVWLEKRLGHIVPDLRIRPGRRQLVLQDLNP